MLLLDRCDDPLSPLIHEFTYQAMVNDLLPIEEGKITYTTDINSGKSESKDVLLNENDELWREVSRAERGEGVRKTSIRSSTKLT